MKLNNNQKKLLNYLEEDYSLLKNSIYKAGPYWDYKTKKILYWIKKYGIHNFRGISSGVGTSYTDNIALDIRNELGFKGRLVSNFFSLPFVRNIFEHQLEITRRLILDKIMMNEMLCNQSKKVEYLIKKYKINDSTFFDCVDKVRIKDKEYSFLYLSMIERIEYLSNLFDFNKIESLIEIGGGFGANIHLLIENFPNIKKIIYVDIFPNIFVGTEYLKKLYPDNVIDYNSVKELKKIKFNNNKNNLEIFCIPSWCIERIDSKLDKFHNCASFQEMTIEQVVNYKNILDNILDGGFISLIVYQGWEKNNTLSPNILNKIFENKLMENKFSQINSKDDLIYLTK